jgi:hypothetical protein
VGRATLAFGRFVEATISVAWLAEPSAACRVRKGPSTLKAALCIATLWPPSAQSLPATASWNAPARVVGGASGGKEPACLGLGPIRAKAGDPDGACLAVFCHGRHSGAFAAGL